jgi:phosphohistidine phosphatase
MVRLCLLRHANSTWNRTDTDDFQRPLDRQGQNAASAMAAFLAETQSAPDLILCSAAKRTRETLAQVLSHLEDDCAIRIERRLYLACTGKLLERLQSVDTAVGKVMLIAHNPGLHELAMLLAKSGDPADLTSMRTNFPAGATAELAFDGIGWHDIAPETGRLLAFVAPSALLAARQSV